MSDGASREMTLEEYMDKLPEIHAAKREYRELLERGKCYIVKSDESNNPPESVEEGKLNVDIWLCPIIAANKAMREELVELHEWYNRHTNATPGGPTEPPKPLEGGTVVIAGETSEGGDGNEGGD